LKISAAILTGGENSRMNGELKALLKIDDFSIIAWQYETLADIFEEIFICGKKANYNLQITVYEDEYINCGPVSGIYSALKNVENDYVFVFSCDMPFLNKNMISQMILVAATEKYDAIIPSHKNGIEPLHGIYSKNLLSKVENQLKQKDFRIRQLYEGINIKFFDVYLPTEPEIAFFNINTQSDLNKAKDYAKRIDK